MKKNLIFSLRQSAIIALTALVFSSCQDHTYKTYQANVPLYMSEKNWRNLSFALNEKRPFENPGKIYIYGQYLFINEFMEGIHIIDNADPANPVSLGFLDIVANVDMAVKDNILYADSYTDLLSFDISDPRNPVLVDRDTGIFEINSIVTMNGYDENLPIAEYFSDKGVVIGWEQKEITIEEENQYLKFGFFETLSDAGITNADYSTGGGINSASVGIGGSMARFTVYDDYLYTLQDFTLHIYDISNASDPVTEGSVNIDRSAETLFPSDEHLFIGTTTGMIIYNLSSPTNPVLVSVYDHITSCDPVIVHNKKAYVTMSSGTRCWGNTNQMDVINVENYGNPQLIKSYNMTNPKGLAIDGNTLFLCDGYDGLKVYDISNALTISDNLISHFKDINTYDVIAFNHVLIMVGDDGVYQYDYSDLSNISELSVLPIYKN